VNLTAVLFDLDNTLILFEEPVFFKEYMKQISVEFSDLMDVQQFTEKLLYSTLKMVDNNGEQTNAEYFIEFFADGLNIDRAELWKRFELFYEHKFEQFRSLMTPLKDAADVLSFVQQKGQKLVIATNPMFPMNVQLARLRWAGLADFNFDLITSADNTTFCKPRLEYYHQVCEMIQLPPEQCIMVGNDPFNDMIASKIGMKTYLTTDSHQISIELSRALAKNAKLEMPKPDFKGPLSGLKSVVDQFSHDE